MKILSVLAVNLAILFAVAYFFPKVFSILATTATVILTGLAVLFVIDIFRR